MATRYASLARCPDVPERDVIAALISREECAALLTRITRIGAMPARSSSRALLALIGRLATPACAWLEGDLAVELFEEEGATKVRIMSELGAGLRERVLPVVTLAQSVAELVVAFERRRELTAFLRLERISVRCALLLASDEEMSPASTEFDISETSLAWPSAELRRLQGAAPEEVDSGWDAHN